MTNEQAKNQVKSDLMELAQSLQAGAALRGDADILLIATCLSTAITSTDDPRDIADLSSTMMEYCKRKLKRMRGMSDAEIGLAELLRSVNDDTHLN